MTDKTQPSEATEPTESELYMLGREAGRAEVLIQVTAMLESCMQTDKDLRAVTRIQSKLLSAIQKDLQKAIGLMQDEQYTAALDVLRSLEESFAREPATP